MNHNAFDALTRSFQNVSSRRSALRRLAAGGLAASVPLALGSAVAGATTAKPSDGFSLHITAKLHFPGDPELVAHHYCKPVAGGLTECLLFAGDEPDAPLVGVEVIVDAATHAEFDAEEQQLWHYHKDEIPLVEATLPDLSAEEAAEVVKAIEETYGKLYLLWDPGLGDQPIGYPSLTVLHGGTLTSSKGQ